MDEEQDKTVASAADVTDSDVTGEDKPQEGQPEEKVRGGTEPPAHGGKNSRLEAEPPAVDGGPADRTSGWRMEPPGRYKTPVRPTRKISKQAARARAKA